MSGATQPSMHFVHQAKRVNGAHIKIWHYYEHVRDSGQFDPSVWLAHDSRVTPDSPWAAPHVRWLADWNPSGADALFLSGTSWRHVPDDCTVPVLNLLQSIRHAHPNDVRFGYLRRRAFRVSISNEITEAVAATGIVNGPVVTVPLASDVPPVPDVPEWTSVTRPIDVVVAGLKNPALAVDIANTLQADGIAVRCVTTHLERSEFLQLFRSARVAVTLPTHTEGFFMVPMEALAHGCIPVCPDVPGTRPYREHPAVLSPDYRLDAIVGETRRALALAPHSASAVLDAGVAMVREHSLDTERRQFLGVLDDFVNDW